MQRVSTICCFYPHIPSTRSKRLLGRFLKWNINLPKCFSKILPWGFAMTLSLEVRLITIPLVESPWPLVKIPGYSPIFTSTMSFQMFTTVVYQWLYQRHPEGSHVQLDFHPYSFLWPKKTLVKEFWMSVSKVNLFIIIHSLKTKESIERSTTI